MNIDFTEQPNVRTILNRIREESRDESEKGRWFKQLFMCIAIQCSELEIDGIWRWPDWPERENLTGLDGRDIGIDLVARHPGRRGRWGGVARDNRRFLDAAL